MKNPAWNFGVVLGEAGKRVKRLAGLSNGPPLQDYVHPELSESAKIVRKIFANCWKIFFQNFQFFIFKDVGKYWNFWSYDWNCSEQISEKHNRRAKYIESFGRSCNWYLWISGCFVQGDAIPETGRPFGSAWKNVMQRFLRTSKKTKFFSFLALNLAVVGNGEGGGRQWEGKRRGGSGKVEREGGVGKKKGDRGLR